jgi:hypothetical protein
MQLKMTDDLAQRIQTAVREKCRTEESLVDAEAPSTVHDAAIRYVEVQIELGELLEEAIEDDEEDGESAEPASD